jgi:hypothetical protein
MANDFSWVPELGKNVGNMLGLDPRAKAEGKLMQGKADLQAMELENKPILYKAQAGNQNAQAGYHGARTKAIETEEGVKADFAANIRNALVFDESTGQAHVDVNKLANLLSAHPYAPKAMAGLGDAIANLNLQVGPQYREETERKYVESAVDDPNPQPPQLEDVPTGKFIQTTPANSLQPSAQLRSTKGAANARVLSDPNLAVTPEGKQQIWNNKLQTALAVQEEKNKGSVATAIARAATPKPGTNNGPKSTDVVNSGKWIEEAEQTVVQLLADGENMDPVTARAIATAAYQDRFGNGMPTENASVVIGEFLKKNNLVSAVAHDPWGWGKHTMGVKGANDVNNKILSAKDLAALVSGKPTGTAPVGQAGRGAAPMAAAPQAAASPQAVAPQAAAPQASAPQAAAPQSQVAGAIAPPIQPDVPAAPEAPYGLRKDGTPKGQGFFQLQGKDGSIMTEVSVGITVNNVETEIPTLVPGLSESEKEYLQNGGDPRQSPSIMTKAMDHARQRLNAGRSVFAEPGESAPAGPVTPPAGIPAAEQRVDGHTYDIPGKGKYKWNASTQKWTKV